MVFRPEANSSNETTSAPTSVGPPSVTHPNKTLSRSSETAPVSEANGSTPAQGSRDAIVQSEPQVVGKWKKHILLALYAMATFVDICNISGARMAVAPITHDLGLAPSQGVWVINAYALSFAAFLLVAGRLADTFQVRILFLTGLIGLGSLCLVTSFITNNKYGFFVIRGISGLCGALIIPAAYRLTVQTFPDPTEQKRKLALLSVASGLGNVIGLLIAGALPWEWFFRVMAIVCLLTAVAAVLLLPAGIAAPARAFSWLALDPLGALLIMSTLVCFNLALTQAPISGWKSPIFIAPFIISIFTGIAFFIWESKVNSRNAMLPKAIWKIPNAIIATLAIMVAFPFWATTQVQYATYYQDVGDWPPTRVAAAMLPQGIVAVTVGVAVRFIPSIVERPRETSTLGAVLMIGAYLLQIFSAGGLGLDYWRFCLPAFSIGSAGALIAYFATSINFITFCPPEYAGVAGAWTQVVTQTAGALCLAIQAAFTGDQIADWSGVASRAFYFMVAWTAVLSIQYIIWYRVPGTPAEEHERTRARIRASGVAEDEQKVRADDWRAVSLERA